MGSLPASAMSGRSEPRRTTADDREVRTSLEGSVSFWRVAKSSGKAVTNGAPPGGQDRCIHWPYPTFLYGVARPGISSLLSPP
jgi:hypothetical protein